MKQGRLQRLMLIIGLAAILLLAACDVLLLHPTLTVYLYGNSDKSAIVDVAFGGGGGQSFHLGANEYREVAIPVDISGEISYTITVNTSEETLDLLKKRRDALVLALFSPVEPPDVNYRSLLLRTQEVLETYSKGVSCSSHFIDGQLEATAIIEMYTNITIQC